MKAALHFSWHGPVRENAKLRIYLLSRIWCEHQDLLLVLQLKTIDVGTYVDMVELVTKLFDIDI